MTRLALRFCESMRAILCVLWPQRMSLREPLVSLSSPKSA
jgi:hypothetical protein